VTRTPMYIEAVTKWICLAPFILVASCVPATQTIVELNVGSELANQTGVLTVLVTSEGGEEILARTFPVDSTWRWPAEIPLHPRGGDVSRRFRFSATFSDEAGSIDVRAALGFAEGTRFRVLLRFEESCRERVCGAGFTCESGGCVSIFRDSECNLPDGVGCDLETGCGCPDDHVCLEVEDAPDSESSAPTCLRRVERSICTGAADCAEDEHCGRDGECRPETSTLCTPGRSGLVAVGGDCNSSLELECAEGLVCLSRTDSSLDDDLNFSFPIGSRCRIGCNPCESSATCQAPNECIALPDGGGFCYRDGVALETQTCDFETRFCGNGLSCHNGRCVRMCRGHFPDAASPVVCAIRSSDCDAGELCTRSSSSSATGVCRPGAEEFPSPEGGLCTLNSSCPCPLECVAIGGGSHMCRRRGTTCGDCENRGLECLSRRDGMVVACIAPRSLRAFDPCEDGDNCQSGYCNPDGICLPTR
jgi:hypothetical protein